MYLSLDKIFPPAMDLKEKVKQKVVNNKVLNNFIIVYLYAK
jgi:hypothetical protein